MLYFSDFALDQLLLEDIHLGDLTTRSLGIGDKEGKMTFRLRGGGRVSGIRVAALLLGRLGLSVKRVVSDGMDVEDGAVLLVAHGRADQLHQGWKVAQNVLEWACGVASGMAGLLAAARSANPMVNVACTRKSIPGTKLLAQEAVLHGGGILHRGGMAETILLFANHRCFCPDPADWKGLVEKLRSHAPEKKIVVEADTMDEAGIAIASGADVVQLDKFTPDQVEAVVKSARRSAPLCQIIAAGGIHRENAAAYAATGVPVLVSSAPYYTKPADVKVILSPVVE